MAQTKINIKPIIFTFLFILLLVYFLVFEKKIEEKDKRKNNIFTYVIADVKKFAVEKKGNLIEVERILNNWRINKPRELPGSKTDIDSYLQDVRDLQKLKTITEEPKDLKIYGLHTPKIIFKVWTTDKLLVLNIGDQNPDQSAYYAQFEDQSEVFLLELITESTIDKDLYYFRNKEIFTLSVDDVKECLIKSDKKRYVLKKENDIWKMEKPVVFDNPQEIDIKNLIGEIIDINIQKFYDNRKEINLANTSLLSPLKIIKIIDNQNKIYILYIGKEIKDEVEYYAKLHNNKMIFAVDKNIVDNIIDDVGKIEEEKKEKEEAKKENNEKKEKHTKSE